MGAAEYDDEEESEDESFNEDAVNSQEDDDESGEFDKDGSGDVDMIDEDVDKNELRAIQKDVEEIDLKAGRPRR